jgi:AraC family transcriptional regulator
VAGNGHPTNGARSPLSAFSTPLTSSAQRPGWERVLIESHRMPPGEAELCTPQLRIFVTLEPARRMTARLAGGPLRSAHGAPGGLFIIPPGHSHWATWDGATTFLALYLVPEAIAQAVRDDGLDADRLEIQYRFAAFDPEFASLALALHQQLASPDAEDRLYVDTLSVQLAVHVLRRYGTTPLQPRSYRGGLSRAKMRAVLDYLNAHLCQNVQLSELARLVEMSPFHFLRLFRDSSGLTPHQYLVHRRVEVARSMLVHGDLSLADVAHRVGFADQSHFTRHFRRLTGAPPGQLRRAIRAH